MTRTVDLCRHTDSEGDVLTPSGVEAGLGLAARLHGPYEVAVSSGAQRATQTLACVLAMLGDPVPQGVLVEPGLRSEQEDRWRELYGVTGSGALEAFREADREFVEAEAARLGAALGRVIESLPDGARALAVGHSPTNEAAVYGLCGVIVAPLGKGEGVRVVAADDRYSVEQLA